jgi:PAS domain S-box-containing protein
MSLRIKVILVILVTTLVLLGAVSLAVRQGILPYFEEQQHENAAQNADRIISLLQGEQRALEQTARDWASWDDTYLYASDHNSAYEASNLLDNVLIQLQVNSFVILDLQGQILYGKEVDLISGKVEALSGELLRQLKPGSPLLFTAEETEMRSGLVQLDGQPCLLVAHPILHTDGTGPTNGTIILTRRLTSAEMERLIQISGLPFQLLEISAVSDSADQKALTALQLGSSFETAISPSDQLVGYTLMPDLNGNPGYLLRFEQPRSIYRAGTVLLNYLLITIAGMGILFTILLFSLLEWALINRLARTQKSVLQIGQTGDLTQRIHAGEGRDEVDQLSRAINQMLANLEQSELARQETEERFRSLVESIDDIIFSLNPQGQLIAVYGRGAERRGYTRQLQSGQKLDDLLGAETEQQYQIAFQKALDGEVQVYEWEQTGPNPRTLQVSLSPLRNPRRNIIGVVGVGRDITEIKQLQSNLNQRLEELSALYEVSQVFLGQSDVESTLQSICHLSVNRFDMQAAWIADLAATGNRLQAIAAHGFKVEQLNELALSLESSSQSHPGVWAFQRGQPVTFYCVDAVETLRSSARGCRWLISLPLQHSGETLAVLNLYSAAPNGPSREQMQVLQAFSNLAGNALQNAQLFTALQKSKEELKNLSRRLTLVQEEERRQVAFEVNEEVGALLRSLRKQLELPDDLSADVLRGRLLDAARLAEDLSVRLQRLTTDIRPAVLDEQGLFATLLWYVNRFNQQSGITTHFEPSGLQNRRFTLEIELITYRLVQEILASIARHQQATQITVQTTYEKRTLHLMIQQTVASALLDAAFKDMQAATASIRERLSFLHGKLTLEQQETGLTIHIEIPAESQLTNR